jgi:hypothetical protein
MKNRLLQLVFPATAAKLSRLQAAVKIYDDALTGIRVTANNPVQPKDGFQTWARRAATEARARAYAALAT